MGNVQKVGLDEFQGAVLEASEPVLVDFFAPWCGPCRLIAPILDELSGSYAGKVKFVKVDIDEAPDIAERYAVSGVPTLILFKAGQEADRQVGALPRPSLESWVKSFT